MAPRAPELLQPSGLLRDHRRGAAVGRGEVLAVPTPRRVEVDQHREAAAGQGRQRRAAREKSR